MWIKDLTNSTRIEQTKKKHASIDANLHMYCTYILCMYVIVLLLFMYICTCTSTSTYHTPYIYVCTILASIKCMVQVCNDFWKEKKYRTYRMYIFCPIWGCDWWHRKSAQLISTPRERKEVIKLAEIRYREIIILETSYIHRKKLWRWYLSFLSMLS